MMGICDFMFVTPNARSRLFVEQPLSQKRRRLTDKGREDERERKREQDREPSDTMKVEIFSLELIYRVTQVYMEKTVTEEWGYAQVYS